MRELTLQIMPWISTGNVITWALVLSLALVWWIRGMADRRRAENEGKKIDNDAEAVLRAEMMALNQKNRDSYHDLANKFMSLEGTQKLCEKKLAERDRQLADAHAENRTNRDDMNILKFIIRLLFGEIERLDKRKGANPVIAQAREMLEQMEHKNGNGKVDAAAAAAASTVYNAEITLHAAEKTQQEIGSKGEGKP